MNVRKNFYEFYWRMQRIIAPSLKYSQNIFEDVIKNNIKQQCSWLDLGCGHHILPPWRYDEERRLVQIARFLVGLDCEMRSLKKHRTIRNKIFGDISSLPFQANSFDLVTSNMVFEHLKEPKIQLKEIIRILKPGGVLIFHTPNALGYTTFIGGLIPEFFKKKLIHFLNNRIEDDVFPTYYRINTPSKIKILSEESGFITKEIRTIASSAQFVMIPPLLIPELMWIRLTMSRWFRVLRTNIIVCLVKPQNTYNDVDSTALCSRQ